MVLRLTIPRTGRRNEKIQPTPGTGLPPMRRPGSKSHSYSAWNSWNESLDTTVASVRFAIWSRKPSPRPTAPAGGRHDLVRDLGLRERGSLRRVDAVLEAGVDDDGHLRSGVLPAEGGHGLAELGEARLRASLGGEVGAVDHEMVGHQALIPNSVAARLRSIL